MLTFVYISFYFYFCRSFGFYYCNRISNICIICFCRSFYVLAHRISSLYWINVARLYFPNFLSMLIAFLVNIILYFSWKVYGESTHIYYATKLWYMQMRWVNLSTFENRLNKLICQNVYIIYVEINLEFMLIIENRFNFSFSYILLLFFFKN